MHQSTRKPMKSGKIGHVRIIGGQWKGRRIKFSQVAGLRPTLDRVRETLFNWLMYDIKDARCLDLFAGSGALGIEALSRGANELVFVEKNKKAADNLKQNLASLNYADNSVFNTSAEVVFKKNQHPFDIIFIDPPFFQDYLTNTLNSINTPSFVKSGTLIYVEREKHSEPFSIPPNWQLEKEKQLGGLEFYLYQVQSIDTINESDAPQNQAVDLDSL